jgi:hypothetical protein
VATVVAKLFGAGAPCRAYFGEKDFQQAVIVRALARELLLPVEIVLCPTVREVDGLALSSRNARLGADERRAAPVLYRALVEGRAALAAKATAREAEEVMAAFVAAQPAVALDYAVVRDEATLGSTTSRRTRPTPRPGSPMSRQKETMTAMPDSRCFELRTYVASPGKLDALVARFRDHTMALFVRHGIEVVSFFVDTEAEMLFYVNVFNTREEAAASWAAFQADPDWIAARAASEVDGRLAASVESRFVGATDFSPLR